KLDRLLGTTQGLSLPYVVEKVGWMCHTFGGDRDATLKALLETYPASDLTAALMEVGVNKEGWPTPAAKDCFHLEWDAVLVPEMPERGDSWERRQAWEDRKSTVADNRVLARKFIEGELHAVLKEMRSEAKERIPYIDFDSPIDPPQEW